MAPTKDAGRPIPGITQEMPYRPPSQHEVLGIRRWAQRGLWGFMVKRLADKAQAMSEGGNAVVKMHFRQ
jgi:hypothetical protein